MNDFRRCTAIAMLMLLAQEWMVERLMPAYATMFLTAVSCSAITDRGQPVLAFATAMVAPCRSELLHRGAQPLVGHCTRLPCGHLARSRT
jgi:hypothetical protein